MSDGPRCAPPPSPLLPSVTRPFGKSAAGATWAPVGRSALNAPAAGFLSLPRDGIHLLLYSDILKYRNLSLTHDKTHSRALMLVKSSLALRARVVNTSPAARENLLTNRL